MPTPLGSYTPDWAVLVTTPDGDRLYFVVETRSSLFASDLRNAESAKIECGRAHFKALAVGENSAIYDRFGTSTTWFTFRSTATLVRQ